MKHIKLYESLEGEKTFSFEELSPQAKATALENHRDINTDWDSWQDDVLTDAESELEQDGFTDVEIHYSGFYSQGDGASFTGQVENPRRFVEGVLGMEHLPDSILDLFTIESVRGTSRYYHEKTVALEVDYDDSEGDIINEYPLGLEVPFTYDLAKIAAEIKKRGDSWLETKCRKIYRRLEKEWDWLSSDESVEDALIANGLKFTEDGEDA